jgi:hypothetical protein
MDFLRRTGWISCGGQADVFVVTPKVTKKDILTNTFSATTSIAVWPFYLLLALMLAIVGWLATAAT